MASDETIRVVIVDDSSFMRTALKKMLAIAPDIEVVGEARDGKEAIEVVRREKPQIVTMDLEMPGMNGLDATRSIVAEHGRTVAVIMVSSHTQAGADATIRALKLGAVDFISKSTAMTKLDLGQLDSELVPKIRQWVSATAPGTEPRAGARAAATPPPARIAPMVAAVSGAAIAPVARSLDTPSPGSLRPARPKDGKPVDLVLVGVSTGGPTALPEMLAAMGKVPATVVIAQHMPEFFTASFAEHLARDLKLDVREGKYGERLTPGSVTILPGGRDSILSAVPRSAGGGVALRATATDGTIHPSVDKLFQSASLIAANTVGVILTGMGSDGAKGAAALARLGCPVLVQRPETAIVGGMPSAALEAGVASELLTLTEIGRRLANWCRAERSALTRENA
jgi:two-component system chemotaxis response regulator CheB